MKNLNYTLCYSTFNWHNQFPGKGSALKGLNVLHIFLNNFLVWSLDLTFNYDANKGLQSRPYQLFCTIGLIPGSFQVQISVLFWQTHIQQRLGLIPGLIQQLFAYWMIKSKKKKKIKLIFKIATKINPYVRNTLWFEVAAAGPCLLGRR